jgi:hypothetical protein
MAAIDCVNRGGDFLAAKKLIGAGAVLERKRIANPDVPLGKAMA